MTDVKTFRTLDAWRVAMDTVEATYQLTKKLPPDERFGLVSQMRRAAISIPSNVAEGQVLGAARWALRHISIALGSAAELETQLEVAIRLGLVAKSDSVALHGLIERVQQLLYGLRREKKRRLRMRLSSAGLCVLLFYHFVT